MTNNKTVTTESLVQNKRLYDRMTELYQIIDQGDFYVSEFYVDHRHDRERIESWLLRLQKEKEQNDNIGKTDLVLSKSMNTLLAHMELDRIQLMLKESNDDTDLKSHTVV